MPSDFISLLSADLDLESPKSLYSRGESGWGLGCGGGEAGPGGTGGVPVGGWSKPGPVGPFWVVGRGRWGRVMVEGAGEEWRPLPRGAAGRTGPNCRRPRVSAAPVALRVPRRVRPRHTPRAAGPGLPSSGISAPPPPRSRVGPALGPLRSVRRGPSYQDHPPQQSCPQTGGVAWSRFWVQGHHFSPPPGCLCAVVLPPSPFGLVHSLPLLGRPPSTRRSSFPRHLNCWKGPEFSVFLSTSVAF